MPVQQYLPSLLGI